MFDKTEEKFRRLIGREDITVLGLESSCDETAAAVTQGRQILGSSVVSQADIHKKFGGVVPEVASRNHTMNFTAVVDDALKKANRTLDEIDVIAVTSRPGLIGPLLIGVSTAKALCFAKNIPLVSVNHIEAHICANYAVFDEDRVGGGETASNKNSGVAVSETAGNNISNRAELAAAQAKKAFKGSVNLDKNEEELKPPFLALVASGGHTSIIDVVGFNEFNLVGRTTDDAIGEAFDKVARIAGLPYPGGPNVDLHAKTGSANIEFMRNRGVQKDYSLSYSGLKTAVVNYVHKLKQRGESINIADICASFTRHAVDMLVDTLFAAAENLGRDKIAIAGGVASNSYLRETLKQRGAERHIIMPPPQLCTDNAVMVAIRGFFSARAGKDYSDLSLNASSVI